MRQLCRTFARSLSVFTFVALAAGLAAAQEAKSRDLRLISARAGGINYVAGEARVLAAGETNWRALDTSHELNSGDAVRTGAGGRLEVLLNPGSYMRVGQQTEFELGDTSLDNLRLRVTRGSVIVEATGFDDLDPSITVTTPQTEVVVLRSGVYRIDVAGGTTEVSVIKGRANVGGTLVKGEKVARVGGAGLEVVKYDKKRRDELDLWSKERAGDLAEANRDMSSRSVRTLLADRWDDLFYNGSRADFGFAQGVWVFNPRTSCYTFVPLLGYGYGNWRSPYGSYYASQFAPYNCPGCYLSPRRPATGGTGGTGGRQPVARPNFPSTPRQSPVDRGARPTAPAPSRTHSRPAVERPAAHPRPAPTRRNQ